MVFSLVAHWPYAVILNSIFPKDFNTILKTPVAVSQSKYIILLKFTNNIFLINTMTEAKA